MNVLIVGCGKAGMRLARRLSESGHDVSVVDREQSQLDTLGDDFEGMIVLGEPIDQDVLRSAGAENADVAVAITPDDNVNVMVTQVLKTVFQVDTVYTRLLDPAREKAFRSFGMNTMCSVRYEVEYFYECITQQNYGTRMLDLGGSFAEFDAAITDKHEWGRRAVDMPHEWNEMLFAVRRRDGRFLLANIPGLVIEEGDQLIYARIDAQGGGAV